MTLFLNKHIDNAQFEAHNCSTNAEDTFFFEIVYFIQCPSGAITGLDYSCLPPTPTLSSGPRNFSERIFGT